MPSTSRLALISEFVHAADMAQRLDHKLDCKKCGTVTLEIPADATETTPIRCSTCGALLGNWGNLQFTDAKPADNETSGDEDGSAAQR